MTTIAALPFYLVRGHDVHSVTTTTSTTERIHGLLRLEADRLVVQWRIARVTERHGWEVRTDHEIAPVREVVVPLGGVAGAAAKKIGWTLPPGPQLVLTAADMRAFEEIAGEAGLRLAHPATLVFRIRRVDRLLAAEFAADLNLALAELALERTKPPLFPLSSPAAAEPTLGAPRADALPSGSGTL